MRRIGVVALPQSKPVVTSGVRRTFEVVHRIALRHCVGSLPADCDWLLSCGMVHFSERGFCLTNDGHRLHRALLDRERASLDLGLLGMVHEPLAGLARRFIRLRATWIALPSTRSELLVSFHAFVVQAETPLLRASGMVPRFEPYRIRLRGADGSLQAGDLRFAIDEQVDSVAVVWDELQEDYLQTLGRGHELEDI